MTQTISLDTLVAQQIRQSGPISFRDFMDLALYHPSLGYYTSGADRIGATADYYTSAYLTSFFGSMIGRQLEEMWRLLGQKAFTIVEFGAGTGLMCQDILNYLQHNKEMYDNLQYCIVEKSHAMRKTEQAHLPEIVRWYDAIGDIGPVTGCILSNELLDNFPVHRVVMDGALMEVYVDYANGFTEVLQPAPDALHAYLDELHVALPERYHAEIGLQATTWITEMADALEKGFVLTIDYGFPAFELYQSARSVGTLACYYRHQVHDNPYVHIGNQDITAHVNFSALCHWGARHGLQYCGYTDQSRFLHALGLVSYIRELEAAGAAAAGNSNEQLCMLQTFLVDMGHKLKVLIQQKGLHCPQLSSMRFALREMV